MAKHIENESRTMISEIEYSLLIAYYKYHKNIKTMINTNYYFDTEDLILTNNHMMLRIRKIDNSDYELTFKNKGENGDLEINQNINENDANLLLNSNIFPKGEIYEENYVICIDDNRYTNGHDYNIEIESNISVEHAHKTLHKLCDKFTIDISHNYLVKSARAILNAIKVQQS